MYNHNKAQQSKNRVHISWDILYSAVPAALIEIYLAMPGLFRCKWIQKAISDTVYQIGVHAATITAIRQVSAMSQEASQISVKSDVYWKRLITLTTNKLSKTCVNVHLWGRTTNDQWIPYTKDNECGNSFHDTMLSLLLVHPNRIRFWSHVYRCRWRDMKISAEST